MNEIQLLVSRALEALCASVRQDVSTHLACSRAARRADARAAGRAATIRRLLEEAGKSLTEVDLELIEEARWYTKHNIDVFRVRNSRTQEESTDIGLCYSCCDYFDIYWDSGTKQMGVTDLSHYGIFEVDEEV